MNPEDLRQIGILKAVDDAARARLAAVLETEDHTEGQAVFAEGGPGDSMYFLVSGRIRIEKRTASTGAATKVLTVLEPGDYFGEMALLDQKPRSASAVAAGPARTWRLSKTAFDALHGEGGKAGMSVLFAMIRTSSERIRRLSAHLVVYDEIGKAIGESRDLQGLLDVVLRQLAGATLADWGLLLLRSPFSQSLEVRSLLAIELTPAQKEEVATGQGFLQPALASPEARLVANIDREEPFQSARRLGFETPALLLAPIALAGDFLGLLVLGGRESDQFDLDALNLATGVARQTAQAILNARHREEEQSRSRHARQFVRF